MNALLLSEAPVLPGFQVVRDLGPRTWEAIDRRLERRVAIRRVDGPLDGSRWPEAVGVARLFTMIESQGHRFVVSQVPADAATFAERVASGSDRHAQSRWLDQVALISGGCVHGALDGDCILIGGAGEVMLIGFGESVNPSPADDRRAVRRLRSGRTSAASQGWVLFSPKGANRAGAYRTA